MKDAVLLTLLQHDDLSIHLIGWGIPIFIALFTMLYKGIWKAINANDKDAHDRMDGIEDKVDAAVNKLAELIGEHKVRHPNWDGTERRANPNRPTHPDYRKEISNESEPEVFGRSVGVDWDKGDQGDGIQP